jgi:hypothetical protein
MDYKIINDVLSQSKFVNLRDHLYSNTDKFRPVDVGLGHKLYAYPVDNEVNYFLNQSIINALGLNKLKDIMTFARLNTATKNTEFRVHSDSKIYQNKPNLAAVFLLKI